jgi:hypothetical protein
MQICVLNKTDRPYPFKNIIPPKKRDYSLTKKTFFEKAFYKVRRTGLWLQGRFLSQRIGSSGILLDLKNGLVQM